MKFQNTRDSERKDRSHTNEQESSQHVLCERQLWKLKGCGAMPIKF